MLYEAVKDGQIRLLKILLEEDEDPNRNFFRKDHESLLSLALSGNHDNSVKEKMVRLLLQYGADVNRKDRKEGRTPLMSAARSNEPSTYIISLLLNAGAELLTRDIYGSTAMDYARQSKNIQVFDFLRERLLVQSYKSERPKNVKDPSETFGRRTLKSYGDKINFISSNPISQKLQNDDAFGLLKPTDKDIDPQQSNMAYKPKNIHHDGRNRNKQFWFQDMSIGASQESESPKINRLYTQSTNWEGCDIGLIQRRASQHSPVRSDPKLKCNISFRNNLFRKEDCLRKIPRSETNNDANHQEGNYIQRPLRQVKNDCSSSRKYTVGYDPVKIRTETKETTSVYDNRSKGKTVDTSIYEKIENEEICHEIDPDDIALNF